MLDLVLRGGVVVDGSGMPRRAGADLGVRDGRVVAVGEVDEPARRVLDVEGQVVAPGFVDVHTHYDAQVCWDETFSPSPLHGVTTVVGGNCGFSLAPVSEGDAEYMTGLLARVEGMPLEALQAGVAWDWATTADYLDRVDAVRPAVNVGFLAGHTAIRRAVLGDDASSRPATAAELAAMSDLLRDALAGGALGFSSSWSTTHNDPEGAPVPSRAADRSELVALASVCSAFEGTSLEFVPRGGDIDDDEAETMIAMSRAARRPLNWNLLVASAEKLEQCREKLELGRRAAGEGARIVALAMPVPPVLRYSFRTGFVLDSIPGWERPMALPPAEKRAMLEDPEQRARLRELAAAGPRPQIAAWGDRRIVETFSPEVARYDGQVVADIARAEGKDAFDALLDIVCADDLRTIFVPVADVDTGPDWVAREEVWLDPGVVIGGSDAGAHVDFISTFNYPTWFLEHAVRGRSVLTLEEAIGMLSDVPARLYGLLDRGRLVPGAWADVVVLDRDAVGSTEVRTVFDLPAGAGRLFAGARGISRVLVGGEEVVVDGAFTDRRPGRVLRAGLDTRNPSMEADHG